MTASAGTQQARLNATRNQATSKVARDYGNEQLNTDFRNWLNNNGY